MNRTHLPRLGDAACLLYALALVVFFVARVILSEWPAAFALVNSFALFLFVPLPLVAVWAIFRRTRMSLAAAGVALATFAIVFGPLFVPRSTVAASGDAIEVMTFNLGPYVAQPDAVAAAIAAENADIVVVQELTPASDKAIRATLATRYPYMALEPDERGRGLLSRYPIDDVTWIQADGEERATLSATITAMGRRIHLFAPHPNPPNISWLPGLPLPSGLDTGPQERQLLDIGRRAEEVAGTVLVMGDFNMTDQTKAYAALTTTLRDAFRDAGWGFGLTFPHDLGAGSLPPYLRFLRSIPVPTRLLRLDYILHSADMVAESARVGCHGGSDHCYVLARLSWR